MASRDQTRRQKKTATSPSMLSKGGSGGAAASALPSSPSSSTNSCPRPVPEMSLDGHGSPVSSSSMAKPLQPTSMCLEENGARAVLDEERSKESVTVTVRFRPLSPREIRQGEEIAWYADGDMIVRSEHNSAVAYAYDRVFGPTTTTRHIYDVAAQHVVSSAMEGINGTIFAYGVTSSGKTHTMHGDQRSPGVIPLAVKDAFSIIQETPSREFLLRVSYLEIYNEVVNDLLNPAGQNLRIREDFQGTFVEGIKEEVVLSPAHALSLIAAGEEHRHVGSNNFNLLSSRSHTIFTLTIESSPCGDYNGGEAVNLSQLNLIDLAGSESSRAETTGVRRKEGAYINKSLLTLGTVIAKLTDGKSSHIPYRDSKLTRLLQSSLSGHGRVSLICTVTPSSSNSEETHNTLKFAHRAKCIEIQASQNKIIDEKSLIKKYQNEIQCLKEELDRLKKGIIGPPKDVGEDDILLLKQKLQDGHVKLQSRLEQEEDAKAALLGRIQRLTKLILVSTKTTQSSRFPQRPGPRRRHSFGEEELAYLPYRRRDMIPEDETVDIAAPFEGYGENADDIINKQEKRNRKNGLLNWFKLRKRDTASTTLTCSDGDKSSPMKSHTSPSTPQRESINVPAEPRISNSLNAESRDTDLIDVVDSRQVPDDNYSIQETPSASATSIDHVDLLREQLKILSGEVAFHSSILKRLTEEASTSPRKEEIELEMKKISAEIESKNKSILSLEKQITDSTSAPQNKLTNSNFSPSYAEILEQLNQKEFELEVKTADNRILEDQLQQKICECKEFQETVSSLKEQLSVALESNSMQHFCGDVPSQIESCVNVENSPPSDSKPEFLLQEQAMEIEELRQRMDELTEVNHQLEARNQKLAEESSYAKGLASAAGVELKALSEEVTKLMNYNEKLSAELATLRNSNQRRVNGASGARNNRRDTRRNDQAIKREMSVNFERELALENALKEMQQREADFERKVEESKQKETYLENELANMWVLVAKLKKSHGNANNESESRTD